MCLHFHPHFVFIDYCVFHNNDEFFERSIGKSCLSNDKRYVYGHHWSCGVRIGGTTSSSCPGRTIVKHGSWPLQAKIWCHWYASNKESQYHIVGTMDVLNLCPTTTKKSLYIVRGLATDARWGWLKVKPSIYKNRRYYCLAGKWGLSCGGKPPLQWHHLITQNPLC